MSYLSNRIFIVCLFSSIIVLSLKGKTMDQSNLYKEFYRVVYRGTQGLELDNIDFFIKNDLNPDFCIGESGWVDSNPLSIVSESFYASYSRLTEGIDVPRIKPDIKVFEILISNNADIHKRPYVWERVNNYNNASLDRAIMKITYRNPEISSSDLDKAIEWYMEDCNRLIEAFLEAGADPDMLGHPYPFSYEGMKEGMTDEKAESYFENGTRAIDVAIEKGIAWESQVDLLLRYTTLDEESLKAADRSNDPLMIEKITKLWEKKNS